MKIELHRFDDDGNDFKIGEIAEDGGKLVGDTKLANNVLGESFYDASSKRHVTSADGIAFLDAIHANLSGAYLWATKPE